MLKNYNLLKMKLLGNRFLVKKDKQKQVGKIILLESDDMNYPYTGEIVLIGNQVKTDKYNIGDKIVFREFCFEITDMMEDIDKDNIYIFVEEKNICGKILSKQD